MAGAIGPGDWVECIGPTGVASNQRPDIVGGRVYQVDGLVSGFRCSRCDSFDHPGLHLVGIWRHEPGGFGGCQFRPIYRPKVETFSALLRPAPEMEPA